MPIALSLVLAALQAAPGAAAPPPEQPAKATFVPRPAETKPADAPVDPRTVVAQPAPGPNISTRPPPERPPAGDDAVQSTPEPAKPADPAPSPAPQQAAEPDTPAVSPQATAASAPATPASPKPAGPTPAAPGFSTDVVEPTAAAAEPVKEPDEDDSSSLLWPALGVLLLGGAGVTVGRKVQRRRSIDRTRSMMSIRPSLDLGHGSPVPGLALAGPSASIRSRLEPGSARTWTA